ncbi:uncharacterized protein LOC144451139 isoform X2 [Glandiceps talaboti]
MQCVKAKKGVVADDAKDFVEKRKKNVDRIRILAESSPEQGRKVIDLGENGYESAKRFCMYIGSFSVAHSTPSTRAEFVRLQLQHLREPRITKPALLVINLSGIKVCNPEDEHDVLMAHALKRISYSTCDPLYRQFAFLARTPNGPIGVQYCHVFLTRKEQEAEEINMILGKAFKVAYASLKTKKRFSAMVAESNEEHFADFNIVGDRMREAELQKQRVLAKERDMARYRQSTANDKEKEHGVGQGRVWAKHIAGKAKHKTPYLADDIDNDINITSPMIGEKQPKSKEMNLPANQRQPTVQPSAPPLSPGEERQELVTKQAKRSKPLPPAPYCDIETYSEWTPEDNGSPASPIMVVPETNPKGMQILLQDEQPPPALRGKQLSRQRPAARTGQLLLQDENPPPAFVEPKKKTETVENNINSKSTFPAETFLQDDSQKATEDKGQRSKPPGHQGHKVEVDLDEIRRSMTELDGIPPLPPRSSSYRSLTDFENSSLGPGAVGGSLHDNRSVDEERLLRDAPWFQAGIPREIAMEILQQEEIGAFVVRDSKSHTGSYALSLRVPKEVNVSGIANYLIEYTQSNTYTLKISGQSWMRFELSDVGY